MSLEPPLWQAVEFTDARAVSGWLHRDPGTGRLELTLSDADDVEVRLALEPDDARALALALLAGCP